MTGNAWIFCGVFFQKTPEVLHRVISVHAYTFARIGAVVMPHGLLKRTLQTQL